MNNLKPHYAKEHADDMQKHMHLPDGEKMKLMHEWMNENRKRFDAA